MNIVNADVYVDMQKTKYGLGWERQTGEPIE